MLILFAGLTSVPMAEVFHLCPFPILKSTAPPPEPWIGRGLLCYQ